MYNNVLTFTTRRARITALGDSLDFNAVIALAMSGVPGEIRFAARQTTQFILTSAPRATERLPLDRAQATKLFAFARTRIQPQRSDRHDRHLAEVLTGSIKVHDRPSSITGASIKAADVPQGMVCAFLSDGDRLIEYFVGMGDGRAFTSSQLLGFVTFDIAAVGRAYGAKRIARATL